MNVHQASAAPLVAMLRDVRCRTDDELRVRRTMNLAAAKIEDLERQVMELKAALESARASAPPGR